MRTDTWIIAGGVPLRGEVRVNGAKNSITKLMVASMLTTERCVFHCVERRSMMTANTMDTVAAADKPSPTRPMTGAEYLESLRDGRA